MDLLGLEGCGRAVRAHTEAAKAAVADWDTDGFLAALADSWRSGTSEEGPPDGGLFLSGAGDCPHREDSPAGHKKFTDIYGICCIFIRFVIYCMALSGGAVF